MGNPRCNWVRDRLPLLAGDDLMGLDRRRVERHLIGCPECRARRAGLVHTLDALRAASAESPARADAGSLWPALARQIRESRRPVPQSAPIAFVFGAGGPRPRFWPSFGLALAGLAALGVFVAARNQTVDARATIAAGARPVRLPAFAAVAAPAPPAQAPRPSPAPSVARALVPARPAADLAPPPRYDYALEHGTPMPPDALESKAPSKPSY